MTIETLIENFDLLEDWEERYRYLIDLGRDLEPFPVSCKTDQYRVSGCVSRVWLITEEGPEKPRILSFKVDSDAHIVKGLLAILCTIFSGKTAGEILAVNIKDIFSSLRLEEHLSPSRRNGFFAIVAKIQRTAQKLTA